MKNKNDLLKMLVMQAKCRFRAERAPRKENVKLISKTEDDVLYEKVVNILNEEEEVLDPIARLMDMTKYKKLDQAGKERYFFSLVNKYRDLKNRYIKEKRA